MNDLLRNPFTPTAGATPPQIIGRDRIINGFSSALKSGAGASKRLMFITGPSGSGKTVLLTAFGNQARKHGWLVVDVAAGGSLIGDLTYWLNRGLNVDKTSNTWSSLNTESDCLSFEELLRVCANNAKGLLVTVDEVQGASADELYRLTSAVQVLIGDGINIALVMAGLSSGVAELLKASELAFLRRAHHEELAPIGKAEIGRSFQRSFKLGGFMVEQNIIENMASATAGHAYLIQLVGYYVWQCVVARIGDDRRVTEKDVSEGVAIAHERFFEASVEPAVAGLSRGAIEYLLAIAQNGDGSTTAKISAFMGRPSKDLSSYRRTLLQRELIQAPARGYVEFAIPFMQDYLAAHGEDLLDRYE